jgi:nucleoside-diphosphate-sugar epimerase
MKVAVTGGTGCLGQPLVKRLISNGFEIKVLVLPNDPLSTSLEKKVRLVSGNLNSLEALNLLVSDCEVVFHLAGKVHSTPRSKKEEQSFYTVNVEGTKSLLEAARRNNVNKIIFYSTVGVYGKDADFHGDELSPCQPKSVYTKTKYLAEQLLLDAKKNGGPDVVVLRFPVVYGPLDRGNMANLIKAIYDKKFFYFGEGKALRSMISSGNTAEAALRAALEPQAANQIFCVTDDRDYTLREVVEAICAALGTDWRPSHVPLFIARLLGKSGDLIERLFRTSMPINSDRVRKLSRPLSFSCEKARRMLGYEPVENLQEGISKEVEWLSTESRWK